MSLGEILAMTLISISTTYVIYKTFVLIVKLCMKLIPDPYIFNMTAFIFFALALLAGGGFQLSLFLQGTGPPEAIFFPLSFFGSGVFFYLAIRLYQLGP